MEGITKVNSKICTIDDEERKIILVKEIRAQGSSLCVMGRVCVGPRYPSIHPSIHSFIYSFRKCMKGPLCAGDEAPIGEEETSSASAPRGQTGSKGQALGQGHHRILSNLSKTHNNSER